MSDEFRTFVGIECIVVRDDKSGRIAKIMPRNEKEMAKNKDGVVSAILEFLFEDAHNRDDDGEETVEICL